MSTLSQLAVEGRITPREWQVIQQMRRGSCAKEIAVALSIATVTAKYHMKTIYRKLGVYGRLDFHRKVGFLE